MNTSGSLLDTVMNQFIVHDSSYRLGVGIDHSVITTFKVGKSKRESDKGQPKGDMLCPYHYSMGQAPAFRVPIEASSADEILNMGALASISWECLVGDLNSLAFFLGLWCQVHTLRPSFGNLVLWELHNRRYSLFLAFYPYG